MHTRPAPQPGAGLHTPVVVVQYSPALHCELEAQAFAGQATTSQAQLVFVVRRQRPLGPATVTPSGHRVFGVPRTGPHRAGAHSLGPIAASLVLSGDLVGSPAEPHAVTIATPPTHTQLERT